LETERLGHGHRSGTTRRETTGTKASGPTADHRHRASSRPYKVVVPLPGPPPVITKMRLNSAVKAVMMVSTAAN